MTTNSLDVTTPNSTGTQATVVGVILQLAMVGVGHAVPSLRAMWGPVGTLISLVVGIWAVWRVGSTGSAAIWGAIAGGLGALIGIALAVILGDVPVSLLVLGTAGSTVAGLVGGVVTQMVRRRSATR
jgi:hypothetical protein